MKLLNIDANAKTVKGQKVGYMTAVMYLAPFKSAGINVCPMAELAGCWRGCLNTAGRGGISKGSVKMNPYGIELPDNAIQRCRIKRTRLWADDRDGFFKQLIHEIYLFVRKAERKGLTPVVRLNGTSDIQWERIPVDSTAERDSCTIFDLFPDLTFYDYTKIAKRFHRELPRNYHLSLSYSEASPRYSKLCWDTHREYGASLVIVYRTKDDIANARTWFEESKVRVVDGDANDLRFLDPDKSQDPESQTFPFCSTGRARRAQRW